MRPYVCLLLCNYFVFDRPVSTTNAHHRRFLLHATGPAAALDGSYDVNINNRSKSARGLIARGPSPASGRLLPPSRLLVLRDRPHSRRKGRKCNRPKTHRQVPDRSDRTTAGISQAAWASQHAVHPLWPLVLAAGHRWPPSIQARRENSDTRLPPPSHQIRRLQHQLPPQRPNTPRRWRSQVARLCSHRQHHLPRAQSLFLGPRHPSFRREPIFRLRPRSILPLRPNPPPTPHHPPRRQQSART